MTASGKSTRRGILIKMMILPRRSGKLDGMGPFEKPVLRAEEYTFART